MPFLRSLFISLSTNRPIRRFSEASSMGRKMSSRFVAGVQMEDALRVAQRLNEQGMSVTLDSLGESVSSEADAQRAAEIYHRLLEQIAQQRLNANISVKLTQMGMDFAPEITDRIVQSLTEHCRTSGNFLRIDMEGSALTQPTIDLVRRMHSLPGNAGHIGIVIQAYLYRSQQDIEQLLADGIRIRLCKGAYQEPATVAFPSKSDVDQNYIQLAQTLLSSSIYHGIATHDEAMIRAVQDYARQRGIAHDRFEFQMLYGVRRDLQRKLVQDGYRVRIYLPFGSEWYPYFMRRLAERPANVFFILRNLFRA
jgi:proline dehydrogenase